MEAHLVASVNANGAHVARSGARNGTGIQDKCALVAADLNQRAEFQDQGGNFTWAWCKLFWPPGLHICTTVPSTKQHTS